MRRIVSLLLVALVATGCAATPEPAAEAAVAESAASVPTGRAALTAAQGEPHVLWFWGAH